MLRKLLIIVPVVAIFLLALAFGAQNSTSVTVNLLFMQTELSVAAIAAIFMGIGFSIALVFYILSSLRWRLRYRRLLSKLDKAVKSNAVDASTRKTTE